LSGSRQAEDAAATNAVRIEGKKDEYGVAEEEILTMKEREKKESIQMFWEALITHFPFL
jgi:hypothetical protein